MTKKNRKSGQSKPHPKPEDHHAEKESTNRHVYVEPAVEIDLVEDLKNTYETSQSDTTVHNKRQLFWTKIASGLLLLTAFLAGWQGFSAKKSADTAAQSLKADQRAWVGSKLKMDKFGPDFPYYFTYSFTFKNYGKSPAFSANSQDNGRVYGAEFPENPDYDKPASPLEVRSKSTLFPGEEGSMPGTAHITPDELVQIQQGKAWFYSFGYVTYQDIFNQSHTTHFCWRHGINPPTNIVTLCDTYNDAN